ncbi:RHS repeat-associated core domain-containing protein [Dyella sp. S184]|uniref:RHS repeat domain-containing protein n=1 Tax=Dyella sp. S184 TaxID=1641862 RepID=UPI00131D64F3|nr:RHS repeat-associated core domain-containing protein [Dyella sp. S184]
MYFQGEVNAVLPGQYYDAETNANYNLFRNYNPPLGRYDQPDPIGFRGGISAYAYGNNNALSNIDPSGTQFLIPVPDYQPTPFPIFEVPQPTHNFPNLDPLVLCFVAGPSCVVPVAQAMSNVVPFPQVGKKQPCPSAGNGCEQDQERLMELYKSKLGLITNTPGLNSFSKRSIALSYNAQAMAHNERCPSSPVPLLDLPSPVGVPSP